MPILMNGSIMAFNVVQSSQINAKSAVHQFQVCYLDNNNFASSCFEFVWNRKCLFCILLRAQKYRGPICPKQSPTNWHNDQKIDGAKLSFSFITAQKTFLMHFSHLRKMKIISWDWIAISQRLLIAHNPFGGPKLKKYVTMRV